MAKTFCPICGQKTNRAGKHKREPLTKATEMKLSPEEEKREEFLIRLLQLCQKPQGPAALGIKRNPPAEEPGQIRIEEG